MSLALFVVTPESLWFRGALVLLLLIAVALAGSILLSVQRFFNERREISSRILKEVRIHRAETRLLRSELSELAEAAERRFAPPSGERLQNRELEGRQQNSVPAKSEASSAHTKSPYPVEKYVPTFESGLNAISARLESIEVSHQQALTEILEQSAIRSKQLISMFEAQRLRLEALKESGKHAEEVDYESSHR